MPLPDTDIIYSRATDWFYADLAERLWRDLPENHRAQTRLWDAPDWLKASPAPRVVVVNWVETIHDPRLSQADVAAFMSKVNSISDRALLAAECVGVIWFERQLDGPNWTTVIDVGWQPQTPPPAVAAQYRFLHYAPTQAEQAVLAQVRASRPGAFAARPLPWTVVGALTPERAALVAALADWQPHGFAFSPPGEPFQVRADRGRLDRTQLERVLRQTQFYIWTSHHTRPYFESFRALDALLSGACPVKLDARYADHLRHLGCVLTDVEELRRTATPAWAEQRIGALCDQLLAQPTLGEAFARLWWR